MRVINSLSKYLWYKDYEDFNFKQFSDQQKNEEESPIIIIKEANDNSIDEEDFTDNEKPNNGRISIWLKENQKAVISLRFLL